MCSGSIYISEHVTLGLQSKLTQPQIKALIIMFGDGKQQ